MDEPTARAKALVHLICRLRSNWPTLPASASGIYERGVMAGDSISNRT